MIVYDNKQPFLMKELSFLMKELCLEVTNNRQGKA